MFLKYIRKVQILIVKYLKSFKTHSYALHEDYTHFNTTDDEWHRSNDFTKEEEISVREFSKTKGYNLGEIIGIGFGGVAFSIENKPHQILKYTYDDIEVSTSDIIKENSTEYFANVYDVYELNGVWVIITERLNPLSSDVVNELREISQLSKNHNNEYNFDNIDIDMVYEKLTEPQLELYEDILNMKKEAIKLGFELIDCKIDNMGIKNDHLAMYDAKMSRMIK